MLIKCPECGLQASDKAFSCPHCGYPFQPTAKPKTPRKSNRKRRLPNGFGQISEIKNRNLRKPFRAMVTVGKTQTGRPICELLKPVAYFSTYNEAYEALVEHQKNPYEVSKDLTVREVYEKWFEEYSKTVKKTANMTNAWRYCSAIYNLKISEVRTWHIKQCINDGVAVVAGVEKKATPNIQNRIKSLLNNIMDYAMEYELIEQNYSRNLKKSRVIDVAATQVQKKHIIFTDEEMQTLWNHVYDTPYDDYIIIQCYSGWRPQELGLLKITDVDLEKWTITGGMKTESGTNRIVPIHTKIRDLVKRQYDKAVASESEYLFYCFDSRSKNDLFLNYGAYRRRFINVINDLGLNPDHRAHDPRKQFATMCKRYNVDEYAIKYMIGHAINDITEKVYTTRSEEWLAEEIEKIKL